jgi:hypothetical protein
MISQWKLKAVLTACTLVTVHSSVLAQYSTPPRTPSTPQAQPAPPRPQPAVPSSPLAAPRKAVLDAQLLVNAAKAKIAATRTSVEATFQSKDDWVAAKKAVAEAKAKYDAALKVVMTALQTNPEYQKLLENRKQASAKLDALKAAPRGQSSEEQKTQDDEMGVAAGDILNDGLALNKMEKEARESDPALAAAKDQEDEAKKAYDSLESQVTTAMQTDPDYIAEQADLAAAEANLATAKAALVSAKPNRTPSTRTPTAPNSNN